MTVDEVILFLAVNVFDVEIVRRSMMIFFQRPRRKFMLFLAYFLEFITSIIAHGLDNYLVGMIIGSITLGYITVQYDGSIKRKIFSFAYTFALKYLCELVVRLIFELSASVGYIRTGIPNVSALIISKLLNFMIVLITKKLDISNREGVSDYAGLSVAVLVPVTTAVLEIILIFSTQTVMVIIVSAVIVLFLNIFVFYMYDKIFENYRQKADLVKAEQEREIYYNQCVNVMRSQEALRQFRHDINNQLEMIKIFLDKGNTAELRKQVNSILSNDGTSDPICYSGNIAVDGILNYKLEKINKSGAEIETDLEIPRQLFMSTKDLTLILGNLLDNVTDAFASMQSKKLCFVQIKYSKNRLFIHLKNTYETALVYENGRIISNKSDGESHGIGLKSVLETVEKYNGYMDINHSGGWFSVKIILLISLDNVLEE